MALSAKGVKLTTMKKFMKANGVKCKTTTKKALVLVKLINTYLKEEYGELEYECYDCGNSIPLLEKCPYCAAIFDAAEDEEEETRSNDFGEEEFDEEEILGGDDDTTPEEDEEEDEEIEEDEEETEEETESILELYATFMSVNNYFTESRNLIRTSFL